jgi:hypothetical protein
MKFYFHLLTCSSHYYYDYEFIKVLVLTCTRQKNILVKYSHKTTFLGEKWSVEELKCISCCKQFLKFSNTPINE